MRNQKRRHAPSKTERALSAGIAGIILGAIGGVIIGASFNGVDGALLGALLGAILIGPAEAITDDLRKEGESKPLFYRMFMMSFVGAVLGAILGMLFNGLSLTAIGIIIGLLSGVIGFRVNKILLGVLTGGVIGFLASTYLPELNPAILGALVVFTYRLLSAILFRNQENFQLMAERDQEMRSDMWFHLK